MNKLKLILLTAALVATAHQAAAQNSEKAVPATLSTEKVQNSPFLDASKPGEWSGVLQGKVKDHSTGISFSQALVLNKEKDKTLVEKKSKKPLEIITDGKIWGEQKGGPGQTYITCEKIAPENCNFTIKEKD